MASKRTTGHSVNATQNGISSWKTMASFLKRACPDTLFHILSHAYGHQLIEEERAAMPLAGGIMQHGFQCGMIWGATLAAGAQAHRLFGKSSKAEILSILAAKRLVDSFRVYHNTTDCFDITRINRFSSTMQKVTHFLIKGGSIDCIHMAARYAPVAHREINAAFSADLIGAPPVLVSCSALLAQKMGASDMHTVMAAGLAGGIGLSGGACGALGAAIWLIGLNILKEGADKLDYFNLPRALDAIDSFTECTGHEFECSKIVGRQFENIDDHAEHLRTGGCSTIIEALAGKGAPREKG